MAKAKTKAKSKAVKKFDANTFNSLKFMDELHKTADKTRQFHAFCEEQLNDIKTEAPNGPLANITDFTVSSFKQLEGQITLSIESYNLFLIELCRTLSEINKLEKEVADAADAERVPKDGNGNRNLPRKGGKVRSVPSARTSGRSGGGSRKGKKASKR